MSTIRMFIGTSANGEDKEIEMAYEYTLRKNSSSNLEITWMRQTPDLTSIWGGWKTHTWSTPFSGYRWAIPEACGFEGKAIYTDCDMLNFKDITELYNINLNGKPFAARVGSRFGGHEFCVMVIDCAVAQQYLIPVQRMKKIPETHQRYIRQFSGNHDLVEPLHPKWNSLDGDNTPMDELWHLHYTKMESQPWQPAWFTGKPEAHKRPELVQLYHDTVQEAYDAKCKPLEPDVDYLAYGQYDIIGK